VRFGFDAVENRRERDREYTKKDSPTRRKLLPSPYGRDQSEGIGLLEYQAMPSLPNELMADSCVHLL